MRGNEGEHLRGIRGRAAKGRRTSCGHGRVQRTGEAGRIDGRAGFNNQNGLAREFAERALRHDAAAVEHDDTVGGALRFDQFVGRNQQRAPAVSLAGEQLSNHLATLGVDGRGGLV